jgi:hypothetical protein
MQALLSIYYKARFKINQYFCMGKSEHTKINQ